MLKNAPFESSLSSESSRKAASIVLLWADDSLEFGSASFCNPLSTQAEYEWKVPKYTLEGHGNFLETFVTQHNEAFSVHGGSSAVRRKLLKPKCGSELLGEGRGKSSAHFQLLKGIFSRFCSRVSIAYFGSSFFASLVIFR